MAKWENISTSTTVMLTDTFSLETPTSVSFASQTNLNKWKQQMMMNDWRKVMMHSLWSDGPVPMPVFSDFGRNTSAIWLKANADLDIFGLSFSPRKQRLLQSQNNWTELITVSFSSHYLRTFTHCKIDEAQQIHVGLSQWWMSSYLLIAGSGWYGLITMFSENIGTCYWSGLEMVWPTSNRPSALQRL